jgi:hypothetical protein
MSKSSVSQIKINGTGSKRLYLEQMEDMRERRWARQLQGKELDIHIKEMHAHVCRDTSRSITL